ncbi:MAG: hypothetical protein AAGJ08_15650 [Cyanobacteria bacterium P01_H01_bin.35]
MPNIKFCRKGWISFVVDNFISCLVRKSVQVDGNIRLGKGELKRKKTQHQTKYYPKNKSLKFTQQGS